jgi:hypothetical protein
MTKRVIGPLWTDEWSVTQSALQAYIKSLEKGKAKAIEEDWPTDVYDSLLGPAERALKSVQEATLQD